MKRHEIGTVGLGGFHCDSAIQLTCPTVLTKRRGMLHLFWQQPIHKWQSTGKSSLCGLWQARKCSLRSSCCFQKPSITHHQPARLCLWQALHEQGLLNVLL